MFKRRINKHIINLSLLIATCLSMLVGSSAWILASESNVTKKVDVSNPEAYVKINNSVIYYATVEQALNKHVNNTASVYVIPGTNPTIETQCTVGRNVTLNFILDENETITNESNGMSGGTYFEGFGSESDEKIKNKITINSLNNNSPTIINYGTINIGGLRRSLSPQSATSGDCIVITMQENSSIDSYGTINNYGFIKESFDNNNSKINVYSNVYSSGTINQQLVIYDWSSVKDNGGNIMGNYPADANGMKTFPFNYFDTIQISPIINFFSGSTHNVMVWIYGSSALVGDLYAEGCLIGQNGLFQPANSPNNQEFISWKCTDTTSPTENTLTTNTTKHFIDIGINGDFNFKSFSIPLSYMGSNIEVKSSDYFVPLSNFFNLSVRNGSNVNIDEPIKMMPGSKLTIENGAILNINDSFFVEDISEFNSNKIYKYSTNSEVYKSAELINEGVLTIDADFAGYIKTSANGDNLYSKILTGPNFVNNTFLYEKSGVGSGLMFKDPVLFKVDDIATADVINESNEVSETKLEANTLYTYESDNNNYYWSIPESSYFNIEIVDPDPLDETLFATNSTYNISILDENLNELSNIKNSTDYQIRILENYKIRINSISNYSNARIVKENGESETINSLSSPYIIDAKDYFNATLQITPQTTYTPKLQYSTDGTTWENPPDNMNMSKDNSWSGQFRIIPYPSIDLDLTNMHIEGKYEYKDLFGNTETSPIVFNDNVSNSVSLEDGAFGRSREYTITINVKDNNNTGKNIEFILYFTVN